MSKQLLPFESTLLRELCAGAAIGDFAGPVHQNHFIRMFQFRLEGMVYAKPKVAL